MDNISYAIYMHFSMKGFEMQVICCDDSTCRYNADGFCQCAFPQIRVGHDNNNTPCNICESYEDRRKDDAGQYSCK